MKKNRLETMDRFLTISIGKAPVRTYASHARASHLSCQTNVFFTPSFPQVYLLRLISRFGANLLWWAHPSDVLAKNCNGRKDRFFSVFSIFFCEHPTFCATGWAQKKRGSPMTTAVVKQHRWPVNKQYDCVCLRWVFTFLPWEIAMKPPFRNF